MGSSCTKQRQQAVSNPVVSKRDDPIAVLISALKLCTDGTPYPTAFMPVCDSSFLCLNTSARCVLIGDEDGPRSVSLINRKASSTSHFVTTQDSHTGTFGLVPRRRNATPADDDVAPPLSSLLHIAEPCQPSNLLPQTGRWVSLQGPAAVTAGHHHHHDENNGEKVTSTTGRKTFVRHAGYVCWEHPVPEDTDSQRVIQLYQKDSTFRVLPLSQALTTKNSSSSSLREFVSSVLIEDDWIVFQSYNFPDHFLQIDSSGRMRIHPAPHTYKSLISSTEFHFKCVPRSSMSLRRAAKEEGSSCVIVTPKPVPRHLVFPGGGSRNRGATSASLDIQTLCVMTSEEVSTIAFNEEHHRQQQQQSDETKNYYVACNHRHEVSVVAAAVKSSSSSGEVFSPSLPPLQLRLQPGLRTRPNDEEAATTATVSFAVATPSPSSPAVSSYLRHANYVCWMHPNDGSPLFASDASFRVVEPLALLSQRQKSHHGDEARRGHVQPHDKEEQVMFRHGSWCYCSFESVNYPNHYLTRDGSDRLRIAKPVAGLLAEATFRFRQEL